MTHVIDLPESLRCDFFNECGLGYDSNCDECGICCCQAHASRHRPGCPALKFALPMPESQPASNEVPPSPKRATKKAKIVTTMTTKQRPKNKGTLRQTSLMSFAVRITKAELEDRHDKTHARLSIVRRERASKVAEAKACAKAAAKERNRIRQVKCRLLKKQREIEMGLRNADGKLLPKKRQVRYHHVFS